MKLGFEKQDMNPEGVKYKKGGLQVADSSKR